MRDPRVRVYVACSLDGFVAGPGDDLSWLPGADGAPVEAIPDAGVVTYEAFMADVGALLMGRRTYDVVRGLGGPWPYGERPVLVATHRELPSVDEDVRAVRGDVEELVAAARAAAAGRDVYLDGGQLIRQALDAGLIEELIVTIVPVVLGAGLPLFAGVTQRRSLELLAQGRYGSMAQLVLAPRG